MKKIISKTFVMIGLLLCGFGSVEGISVEERAEEIISQQVKPVQHSLAKAYKFRMKVATGTYKNNGVIYNEFSGSTQVITHEELFDENTGEYYFFNIAWFSEGFIITQFGGEMHGHQVVVFHDEIVGISYPFEEWEDMPGFISRANFYSWGIVSTFLKGVSIYWKEIQ